MTPAAASGGTPCNAQGEAQPLLILGMGKLGGGELNFSSDIDLIFAWPEHGCTQGGRRERITRVLSTRMGQRLIKVLDQPTRRMASSIAWICGCVRLAKVARWC
ncbi:hypothetical protein ACLB1N_29395 [Escherichia coli]